MSLCIHNNNTTSSRLDYWLVDENLRKQIKACDIRPSIRTDHMCVTLTIGLHNIKKGPGYWKLNTSALENQSYNKEIEQEKRRRKKS